ncbi:hypothetical protein EY653_03635 [Enterococcus faecalis]|nr:hypothetical protein [Enterococcus faecalis]
MLISYILLNLFDLLLPTDGNKPISLKYLNNHIKVLKWNACGFRNFYNFKLRIFVQQGRLIQPKLKSPEDFLLWT